MYRSVSVCLVAAAVLGLSGGCSKTAATGGTGGGGAGGDSWVNNGAQACQRYLSHEVVASILTNAEGTIKVLSTQACVFSVDAGDGRIAITLSNAGPAAFDEYQKYLVDPQPLSGVGDKASQSLIGIDAVKGPDRTCTIDAGGAPDSLRLKDAELGQKLGAICNQLFALP
jgi:hypothetical protein